MDSPVHRCEQEVARVVEGDVLNESPQLEGTVPQRASN